MNWKILNNVFYGGVVIYWGVVGTELARMGNIIEACAIIVFLLFFWAIMKDNRYIKKLENTVLEQESVILRTQYIRNRMLEEKNG